MFVGWFTFEYVIRCIAAPHKFRQVILHNKFLILKWKIFLQICERNHEHHRPVGDPALLHVSGLVHRHRDRDGEGRADEVPIRDEEDCPDIQDHEDIEDIQAGEAHHWATDTGEDTSAQVDQSSEFVDNINIF